MPGALLGNLLVFARMLRASGVSVRASGLPDAVRALDVVGVRRRADVRDALRAVLIVQREDVALFDQLFERFWRVWPETPHSPLPRPMHVPPRARSTVRLLAPGEATAVGAGREPLPAEGPVGIRTYSP